MKRVTKLAVLVIIGALLLIPGCKQLAWKDHFKRANQYYSKKDFKNAAIEYEKALEIKPDLLPAHFFLAASYQALYRPAYDNESFRERSSKTVYAVAVEHGVDKELARKLAELNTRHKLEAAYYLLKAKWYEPLKGADLRTDMGYKTDLKIIGKNVKPGKLVEIYLDKFNKSLEEVKNEVAEEAKKAEEEARAAAEQKAKEEAKKPKKKVSKKKPSKKTAKKEEKPEKETTPPEEEKPVEVTREDIGFAIKYIENRLRILKAIEHFTYYMNNVDNEEDKRKAIQALAEIYDRMNDFKNAEKYYLEFFGENPSDPQYYYILAEFYNKYGHFDKAEEYYKKRIELDPTDPEGWLYLANFYSNQVRRLPKESKKEIFLEAIKLMDKSIAAHEKRLELIPEPVIENGVKVVKVKLEALPEGVVFPEKLKEKISYNPDEKVLVFRGTMTPQEKEELLKLSDDPAYKKAINLLYLGSNKEKAYYYLAVVCWAKSYNIRRVMTLDDRVATLKKGLKALDKALEINPEFANAYVYKNLIYRQFAKVNPYKKKYYLKLAEKEMQKYNEIVKKKQAKKKALESLTKD